MSLLTRVDHERHICGFARTNVDNWLLLIILQVNVPTNILQLDGGLVLIFSRALKDLELLTFCTIFNIINQKQTKNLVLL